MKFRITRVSSYGRGKPCENSYQEGNDWYIDIDDLQDLLLLASTEGELIINECECIRIYDDWLS